uniref:Myosinlike protein putative n=1 Tax=Albugo laibachii Nc14 TaxID=890382 RepID=F0WZW0_9STRA|nr:myosinlike protein putative [Albugo laibachii Nc14]|eukprot:CCA27039.1 myosinlike protein putative [Albugo laibachii Nc14]
MPEFSFPFSITRERNQYTNMAEIRKSTGSTQYQITWEGGDLGIALIPLEKGSGVACSRLTKKGFPIGIERVSCGDILLLINAIDTTKMTFKDVVAQLQICDLPATLTFEKPASKAIESALLKESKDNKMDGERIAQTPTSPIGSTPSQQYTQKKKVRDVRPSSIFYKPSINLPAVSDGLQSSEKVVAKDDADALEFLQDLVDAKESVECGENFKNSSTLSKELETEHFDSEVSEGIKQHSDASEEYLEENRPRISSVESRRSDESEILHMDQPGENSYGSAASNDLLPSPKSLPPPVPMGTLTHSPKKKTRTLLQQLCSKGDVRGVEQYHRANGLAELIEREADFGQSSFHLAVKSGNLSLVKYLVQHYNPISEAIDIPDEKGNTPLHFAATKCAGTVLLLLQNGACASVPNARMLTPLIISVIKGTEDKVIIPRMLLKYGANSNDVYENQTIIHTAIDMKKIQTAGVLVQAGAKLDFLDTHGRNMFEKLDRGTLRFLIAQIYFPPNVISSKAQKVCMLCQQKPAFTQRKVNCTHCGRVCCPDCAPLTVASHRFPLGFPGRTRAGAASHEQKRVCKTCYKILKERDPEPKKEQNRFVRRVIGIEWDEVNPNKLVNPRAAGRRGV